MVKEGHDIDKLQFWRKIWKERLHGEHKVFLWKIASNAIAIKHNLRIFLPNLNIICLLCEQKEETNDHLFIRYRDIRIQQFNKLDTISFLDLFSHHPKEFRVDQNIKMEFTLNSTLTLM